MGRTVLSSQQASAWGVLLLICCFVMGPPLSAAKPGAGDKAFNAGKQAESRRDYDTALQDYQEALKYSPNDPQLLLAVARVRFQAGAAHIGRGRKLQADGNLKEALAEFQQAAAVDPSSDAAQQEINQTMALMEQQRKAPAPQQPGQNPPKITAPAEEGPRLEDAQGPPELKPLSQAPINLRITNESKVIFETIGKLAGINVLFDPDFVSKRTTVELNAVSLGDALDQTALITKMFWKVLTANTILVIPDTAVKRREQEEQVIKTFYLSNPITPQELTEAVTAIRTLLETRRIQQINSLNAIIIRDTPDRVAIAEKIIQDIDKAKPEVVVDVAVLEVRRDFSKQLGLFPTTAAGTPGLTVSATPIGQGGSTGSTGATGSTGGTDANGNPIVTTPTPTASISAAAGTIVRSVLGQNYSFTLPGATLNALLGDSHTRVLQRPQVRASDGQKATLRIGDRVPIATGSYQSGVSGVAVNSLVSTQFQYIDVGVNLDITPKVHDNNEISMKVRVEVSQVTSTSNIGGISQPVIGQRIIDHDIRLREGEVNILGGLINTQTTKSVSGVPGLSQIPFVRYLFSNVSDTVSEDEVLIIMTPHTVRFPDISPFNRKSIDVGTEGDVHLRNAQLSTEPGSALASPSPIPGGPVALSPSMQIHLGNSALTQKTGETFEVPVLIENAENTSSASFEVSFNPGLMKLVRVNNGGFLAQGGQPVAIVQRADEASGKMIVTMTRPPGSEGLNGNGTLAILTFQADKAGTTPLGVAPSTTTPGKEVLIAGGSQTTITIQ